MGAKTDYPMFLKVIQAELQTLVIPEYQFHPERRWRFDFAVPSAKVAIEIDGGIFLYGRHNHPSSMLKDWEKFNSAAILGWRVLHFQPKEIMQANVIQTIKDACNYNKEDDSVYKVSSSLVEIPKQEEKIDKKRDNDIDFLTLDNLLK